MAIEFRPLNEEDITQKIDIERIAQVDGINGLFGAEEFKLTNEVKRFHDQEIERNAPHFRNLEKAFLDSDDLLRQNGYKSLIKDLKFKWKTKKTEIEDKLFRAKEELFGAALLSLLIDKLPDLSSISNSVSFLLEKFSNIPSSFHGTLTINEGTVSTQDMLIENDQGRASLTAILNIETNIIDGKINFYEDDEIYLEATLKGNIQNPQILVGGKVFAEENENAPQDIKKLFEEGIHSLIDKLLKVDD